MGLPLRKERSPDHDLIAAWKKDPRLRELVQKNSDPSFLKQSGFIALDWGIILCAAFVGRLFFHPALSLAAVIMPTTTVI